MAVHPKLGAYSIDVESITALRHRYDPARCSEKDCCCSTYEVVIGSKELARLAGYVPLAAKYQPGLIEADGYANPFDRVERTLWALDTDDDGLCRFAYKTRSGQTLCSIHSAALEAGQDPLRAKPRSCALWPLAISEGRHPVLSVAEDAYRFPCNRRRRKRSPILDPGVAELVDSVFGTSFGAKLRQTCEAFLAS